MADVPEDILGRVRRHCATLPEVDVSSDNWAHTFKVRRRVVAYLFAVDEAGRLTPMLVCTADPEERHALLANGHRLGIVLDDATDWDEIGELLTDSYRLVAPKRLAAQVGAERDQ
jgi:hypothetical protein